MATYFIENFDMLPRRDRAAVRRLVQGLGLEESEENLANEARKYRQARGWFVFDFDSTCRGLKTQARFVDDIEMPARVLF